MPAVSLSILIPVYNEAGTIRALLEKVSTASAEYFKEANIRPEIIAVDDGSSDESCAEIEAFTQSEAGIPVRLIRHASNQGKGTAICTALEHARGEFALIQDGDLEYDPGEYPKLLRPLLNDEADLVLGSRFLAGTEHRLSDFRHRFANRLITTLAGMAADVYFSDVETCYKAFRTALARSIPLRSRRFGLDAELPIKFAQRNARIFEVPISYRGRTAEQGKKIRARDGVFAVGTILRTWLLRDAYTDSGAAMLGEMAIAKRFNQWMADTVAPWICGEVLELGAGIGNLTVLLCGATRLYVASDTDSEHLMQLRARLGPKQNLRMALCDIATPAQTEAFRDRFDTVVCLNVLEHVAEDEAAMRNIHGCLRPGGTAVILVPQGPGAYGSLDEVLAHKRRYSSAELKQKMSDAGFHIAEVVEFNRATYPGWILNARILRRRTLSRIQLCLFDLLVPLWRRLDSHLPWPPTSLIAIGVKEH